MVYDVELNRESLENLLSVLSDKNAVVDLLKKISQHFGSVISNASTMAKQSIPNSQQSGTSFQDAHNGLRSALVSVFDIVKATDTYKIIPQLIDFEHFIQTYNNLIVSRKDGKADTLFGELIEGLKEFVEQYQLVDKSQKVSMTTEMSLLENSYDMYQSIVSIRKTVLSTLFIEEKLITEINLGGQENLFSIVVEEQPTVDNLIDLIAAIKALYLLLLEVLGAEKSKFPLRVIKVQSGSIELIISGYDVVIVLIAVMLIGRFTTLDSKKIARLALEILKSKFPSLKIDDEKLIEIITTDPIVEEKTKRIVDNNKNIQVNHQSYTKGSHSEESIDDSLKGLMDKGSSLFSQKTPKLIAKPKDRGLLSGEQTLDKK